MQSSNIFGNKRSTSYKGDEAHKRGKSDNDVHAKVKLEESELNCFGKKLAEEEDELLNNEDENGKTLFIDIVDQTVGDDGVSEELGG